MSTDHSRRGPKDPAARRPSAKAKGDEAKRVVDKVAGKIDEKMAANVAKQERISARAADRLDKLDRIAGHLGAIDVWTRIEPAGRRPRFTRDAIAAAAVRIADTEGFDAVSMRHLAAELGAGTMTLYHYVRTKDELLTLVMDAVMGEVVVPPTEPLPTDWRDALTLVAHRTRDTLRRHPWILDITDDPPFGPNTVRHFDQSLQAVADLDISLGAKFDIVTTVDEYVFGFCLHERNNMQPDDTGLDAEVMDYVERLVATGEYPQLAELAKHDSIPELWSQIEHHLRDPKRFDRNLTRVLNGIEADLA